MPKIYLRLKHFVASWARHNYGGGPDDPGREINIAKMPEAAKLLTLVQMNVNDKVVPQCYCERQWQRMMRGEHIARNSDAFMVEVRDDQQFLTESEVCQLAGVEPLRGEEMGDFVCIGIPDAVLRPNGKTVNTNSQWQLMHDAACQLIDLIEAEFDFALFTYIDQSEREAQKKNLDRYTSDALEAFMSRNDIRNCADDREKRCLWRRYYRYLERDVRRTADSDADDMADEEFYTGKERQRDTRTRHTILAKRVLCVDTAETFPSLHEAARAYQLSYDALRKSLRRNTRCGGRKFELV